MGIKNKEGKRGGRFIGCVCYICLLWLLYLISVYNYIIFSINIIGPLSLAIQLFHQLEDIQFYFLCFFICMFVFCLNLTNLLPPHIGMERRVRRQGSPVDGFLCYFLTLLLLGIRTMRREGEYNILGKMSLEYKVYWTAPLGDPAAPQIRWSSVFIFFVCMSNL